MNESEVRKLNSGEAITFCGHPHIYAHLDFTDPDGQFVGCVIIELRRSTAGRITLHRMTVPIDEFDDIKKRDKLYHQERDLYREIVSTMRPIGNLLTRDLP